MAYKCYPICTKQACHNYLHLNLRKVIKMIKWKVSESRELQQQKLVTMKQKDTPVAENRIFQIDSKSVLRLLCKKQNKWERIILQTNGLDKDEAKFR